MRRLSARTSNAIAGHPLPGKGLRGRAAGLNAAHLHRGRHGVVHTHRPVHRRRAVDVDILDPVEVRRARHQVGAVFPGVDEAARVALRLRRDQRLVQLPIRPGRRRAAVEVEAAVVQLAVGFPGQQHAVALLHRAEVGQGDGKRRARARRVVGEAGDVAGQDVVGGVGLGEQRPVGAL